MSLTLSIVTITTITKASDCIVARAVPLHLPHYQTEQGCIGQTPRFWLVWTKPPFPPRYPTPMCSEFVAVLPNDPSIQRSPTANAHAQHKPHMICAQCLGGHRRQSFISFLCYSLRHREYTAECNAAAGGNLYGCLPPFSTIPS